MLSRHNIDQVRVATFKVPTQSPEADGTLAWQATELVLVEIEAAGKVGLGYSYTAAKPAAALIRDNLAPLIRDQDAFDIPRHWLAMRRQLRNIGQPGLGMMAVAAVDIALWDLKSKLLDVSLSQLIGRAHDSVAVYGSGGFTTYSDCELKDQLSGWVEQGFAAVKMKIGTGVEEDARRVALARECVGKGVGLMVDANGAYDARTALKLIQALTPYNVCWLEEPVTSDDLAALSWLRDRSPGGLAIAAGEYGWGASYFRHMLDARAVDVLQADATRCGYTGFLQTAALCSTHNIGLSAHCAPALHAPLCACISDFRHIEYFHDHARIEAIFFSGGASLSDGRLRPQESPGHGLSLNRAASEQYRL